MACLEAWVVWVVWVAWECKPENSLEISKKTRRFNTSGLFFYSRIRRSYEEVTKKSSSDEEGMGTIYEEGHLQSKH
ncbi:MAG: hypothetical protein FJX01_02710 [Alphaproteobacteria bacterium]|nr:hypothetical protein [Alphaproteobacteria bacterium]